MQKLISVIVPVYNVEPYLERCVNSIINQTYKNLEILLIDDGSTDNSGTICDEYAKKDSRIICVHQQNGGVSKARNEGLSLATGDYIGFIDSDDYIEPNMYELLLNSIEENNADLAICGFKQVRVDASFKINDADNTVDWSRENVINNFFTQGIIKELVYAPVNKLYKKSLLEGLSFNCKYAMGEDILFLFKCIERVEKITYIQGAYYHYIMREGSAMTSSFSKKRLDYVYAIREIEDICKQKYPYVVDKVGAWAYKHTLNTLRQIIVSKKIAEFKEFYTQNKLYVKSNKKKYYKTLSTNQKIDYLLINSCHFLLRVKVKLS
ncbi:MAG: glycosyltransferase family 2 protein [Clostridiales bacterium]|nr:glycosyltransferase family 2 protein [Clostridiales bacterium]